MRSKAGGPTEDWKGLMPISGGLWPLQLIRKLVKRITFFFHASSRNSKWNKILCSWSCKGRDVRRSFTLLQYCPQSVRNWRESLMLRSSERSSASPHPHKWEEWRPAPMNTGYIFQVFHCRLTLFQIPPLFSPVFCRSLFKNSRYQTPISASPEVSRVQKRRQHILKTCENEKTFCKRHLDSSEKRGNFLANRKVGTLFISHFACKRWWVGMLCVSGEGGGGGNMSHVCMKHLLRRRQWHFSIWRSCYIPWVWKTWLKIHQIGLRLVCINPSVVGPSPSPIQGENDSRLRQRYIMGI